MVIVGIDPGLVVTGYGVIGTTPDGQPYLCEGGAVRAGGEASLADRLREIHDGVQQVLVEHRPGVVVVEELYSKYTHPRTAILMGHARGVVYLAAAKLGIPVVGYTASTVKRALTGSGRASKEQVQHMVREVLSLTDVPKPDHVADALALALCHANADRPLAEVYLRR